VSATCAAIGVDLGDRRVGLAGADPTGTIATPLATLERRHPKFWSALEQACVERGCRLLVIGLPRRLDGSEGDAAACRTPLRRRRRAPARAGGDHVG
jgi:putative Holliday junction resolvase